MFLYMCFLFIYFVFILFLILRFCAIIMLFKNNFAYIISKPMPHGIT